MQPSGPFWFDSHGNKFATRRPSLIRFRRDVKLGSGRSVSFIYCQFITLVSEVDSVAYFRSGLVSSFHENESYYAWGEQSNVTISNDVICLQEDRIQPSQRVKGFNLLRFFSAIIERMLANKKSYKYPTSNNRVQIKQRTFRK